MCVYVGQVVTQYPGKYFRACASHRLAQTCGQYRFCSHANDAHSASTYMVYSVRNIGQSHSTHAAPERTQHISDMWCERKRTEQPQQKISLALRFAGCDMLAPNFLINNSVSVSVWECVVYVYVFVFAVIQRTVANFWRIVNERCGGGLIIIRSYVCVRICSWRPTGCQLTGKRCFAMMVESHLMCVLSLSFSPPSSSSCVVCMFDVVCWMFVCVAASALMFRILVIM